MQNARVEAKNIREKSEDVAKKEREQLINTTKQEAETLLENAKKEVVLTMSKAKKELLTEVGEMSVQLTELILKKKIDHKDKERIVSDSMKKLTCHEWSFTCKKIFKCIR